MPRPPPPPPRLLTLLPPLPFPGPSLLTQLGVRTVALLPAQRPAAAGEGAGPAP